MGNENSGFINRVRNFFSSSSYKKSIHGGNEERLSTEHTHDTSSSTGWARIMKDWYDSNFEEKKSRLNKYEVFNFLDKNLSEATACLNIYADNIVSGAIGGDDNYDVILGKDAPKEAENIILETERRTKIKDYVWDIVRDLTCYGDNFEEMVVVKDDDNKLWLDKVKKLPRDEIFADVDDGGCFSDLDFPYIQKVKGNYDKEPIRFDWWRVVHFKIGREIYGVDYSLFANASQRIGRQLLWIDDSIVLARLSRAWMRFAWMVDTKNLSPDEAWEYVEKFKEKVERREVIDRDTGRLDVTDSPPLPDQDLFIPSSDARKIDLKVLSGDLNIGNIADVEYLQKKFFMATNTPKAYAGLEEGVRAKATINQLDIQFSRQIRRRQNAVIPGLKKIYELAFVLAGIDPKSFEWGVVFPDMNTSDEMMRWEMMKLKSEVAKVMAVDIGAVNNEWIYKEVFGFSQEDIDQYAMYMPNDGEEGFNLGSLNPKMANEINSNPLIRLVLQDMKDVIALKADRDKKASWRKVGMNREEKLIDKW